jgi:integrase
MPRRAKGARLWLRPEGHDKRTGKTVPATWIIRDGSRAVRTGCAATEIGRAEERLAAYIAGRHKAPRASDRDPDQVFVSDVLNIYDDDRIDKQSRPQETRARIERLTPFWGKKLLSEVTGRTCRAYIASRSSEQAARRELEDLRAAIRHHKKEGLCSQVVDVVLPPKALPRERWLSRKEAAALIWAAYSFREKQKDKPTKRRSRRHVARFILVALYTGTRAAAICGASFERQEGRGWVDLEAGVFYRRAAGKRETKKRTPPIRLPDRLLAHMRRWKAKLQPEPQHVVEFGGEPVLRVTKAFARCAKAAGLDPEVTPHVLRHTAVTWAMMNGADPHEAEGFFGLSAETRERVYAHHHPDHQKGVADAVTKRPAQKPHRLSGTDQERSTADKHQVIEIAQVITA